jgi:hypothetical protein
MPRKLIASLAGVLGFIGYIMLAVVVADHLPFDGVIMQTVYFLVAGLLWTLPARWLMLWSVGQR